MIVPDSILSASMTNGASVSSGPLAASRTWRSRITTKTNENENASPAHSQRNAPRGILEADGSDRLPVGEGHWRASDTDFRHPRRQAGHHRRHGFAARLLLWSVRGLVVPP